MLCIGAGILTFFFICSAVFTGAGGIIAYRFLASDYRVEEARIVFFCALVAMILLAFLYIVMIVRAKKRTDDLKHVLDLAREGGKIDERRFDNFGSLGTELRILFNETEELSLKRAQRIKYLNNAVTAILSEADMPILLLDSEGNVVHVSPVYFDRYSEPGKSGEVYGSNIEKLHPEVTFLTLSREAVKTHSDVTVKTESFNMKLQPVFTTNPEPDGYIAVFEKAGIMAKAAAIASEKAAGTAAEKASSGDPSGSPNAGAAKHGRVRFPDTMKGWFTKKQK
jgi:transcriptional regulator with PAS, ATPase and Fis domain